mmetsp:Transcript_27166/g.68127  ORF Transcript_27166/g.68127 Transcript_27166/m.68127 type:complete len:222 (+) Transcript_27166:65-730(+)
MPVRIRDADEAHGAVRLRRRRPLPAVGHEDPRRRLKPLALLEVAPDSADFVVLVDRLPRPQQLRLLEQRPEALERQAAGLAAGLRAVQAPEGLLGGGEGQVVVRHESHVFSEVEFAVAVVVVHGEPSPEHDVDHPLVDEVRHVWRAVVLRAAAVVDLYDASVQDHLLELIKFDLALVGLEVLDTEEVASVEQNLRGARHGARREEDLVHLALAAKQISFAA